MLKKIVNAVIQNIWLLVLALILSLSGLTLLIGASFEEVSPTSKKLPASQSGLEEPSGEESSSKDALDDFLAGSGAFGDWEDFSSFYEETQPVPPASKPSKPSSLPSSGSSSAPSSSSTVTEPPVPMPEESSLPEESSIPEGENPGSSSEGPPIAGSETTESGGSSLPAESQESSVPSGEISTPPEGEVTPGTESSIPEGESPMDAPSLPGSDVSGS